MSREAEYASQFCDEHEERGCVICSAAAASAVDHWCPVCVNVPVASEGDLCGWCQFTPRDYDKVSR